MSESLQVWRTKLTDMFVKHLTCQPVYKHLFDSLFVKVLLQKSRLRRLTDIHRGFHDRPLHDLPKSTGAFCRLVINVHLRRLVPFQNPNHWKKLAKFYTKFSSKLYKRRNRDLRNDRLSPQRERRQLWCTPINPIVDTARCKEQLFNNKI